jgi:hypothetical protein
MSESFSPAWLAKRWDERPLTAYLLALEDSEGETDYEGALVLLGPTGFDITAIIQDEVGKFRRGFDRWSRKQDREKAALDLPDNGGIPQYSKDEWKTYLSWARTWRHDNPLPAYPAERVAERLQSDHDFIRLEPRVIKIRYSSEKQTA